MIPMTEVTSPLRDGDATPAWYQNVLETPTVTFQVGLHTIPASSLTTWPFDQNIGAAPFPLAVLPCTVFP